MNKRLTYTVYPQLALDESRPLRDPGCPGYRIGPPKNLRWLRGTVLEVTLGEALEQLREALGTDDFELMAHRLSLPGAMFTGFITDGVCHCCGETHPRHAPRGAHVAERPALPGLHGEGPSRADRRALHGREDGLWLFARERSGAEGAYASSNSAIRSARTSTCCSAGMRSTSRMRA